MKRLCIPLFAIIVVMVASCDVAVERIPLMAYQKQMIPYTKGQEVCFVNKKGETTLFITKDITTEWKHEGTAVTTVWLQEHTVTLQSESGDQISLQMGTYSYDQFAFDHYSYNNIYLTIKGLNFCLPFDCAGKFYTDEAHKIYDTLTINNKVYYDVALEEHNNVQLYYNKTYGILQLRQNGQNILTLQQ